MVLNKWTLNINAHGVWKKIDESVYYRNRIIMLVCIRVVYNYIR